MHFRTHIQPIPAIRLAILVLIGLLCLPASWPAGAADKPLLLGVFPRHNYTETQEMFRPLAKLLSQALGREVQLETTRDFESFWSGVSSRRYDIVHLNQYQYVQAQQDFGYKVLAKNEEFGVSTLSSVILVRADSGIGSLKQLQGKRIMFGGDRSAAMSYLIPKDMLESAGLAPGSYREEFALNPPNALMAVYLHRADACGVGEAVVQQQSVAKEINLGEVKILARSSAIPHLPWAVRNDLDAGLITKVKQTLTTLDRSDAGRNALKRAQLTNIVAATDAEYEPFKRATRSLGQNRHAK